jgi:hypothetical protein
LIISHHHETATKYPSTRSLKLKNPFHKVDQAALPVLLLSFHPPSLAIALYAQAALGVILGNSFFSIAFHIPNQIQSTGFRD